MQIRTFRSALFFYFASVSVVPIVVLGVVFHTYLSDRITESVNKDNLLLAQSLRGEIAARLDQPLIYLRQLVIETELDYSREADGLDRLVEDAGIFESIYKLDQSGKVIAVGLRPELYSIRNDILKLSVSGQDYFQEASRKHATVWSGSLTSTITGNTVLAIIMPSSNGWIVGSFPLEWLKQVTQRQGPETTSEILIVDHEGVLIRSSDSVRDRQGINLRNLDIVRAGLNGTEGTLTYFDGDTERLGSILSIPSTGWFLILSQSSETAFEPLAHLHLLFALTMLLALTAAGAAVTWISSRVNRPLSELAREARRIAAGEFELTPSPASYAEIDQLASDLSSMGREVGRRQEEIRKSEKQYRDLTEGSIQGILIHNNLKPVFANNAWARIFGYDSIEEILCLENILHLFSPNEEQRLTAMKDARMSGHSAPERYEAQGRRRDGSLIWVDNTVRVVDWEGTPAIQSIVVDITERKCAELALKENEALLTNAVRIANLGHLTWDEVRGAASYGSDKVAEILGLSSADEYLAICQSAEASRQWVYPDDRAGYDTAYAEARRRKSHLDIEYRLVRRDGEVRFIHEVGEPQLDSSGAIVQWIMTIRDITERKKVEAERRLSEERFKDIVNASADWFWETDENERFTYLPGRYQFITGVDPSTVLGKTWKEIDNGRAISPEVVAQLEELEALCRERKPYRDQRLDVLTPDGQIRHWRISAKPVFDEHGVFRGYRGGTTDVTQIIEAEDSLHKSEAMLRRSQKIARIGTWEWDEVNQNTLWASEEAARIFGRRPDDRNGLPRNILDRIHPDDREIYRQHMLDTREHPRPYQIAYRLRRSDGEVIHVEEMALPQFDEVGRLVAYSGTIQDVTERAHAEQQLRQSQKMEVVGQLTGGIAHDFNNLLAIILGNAQLIEQRLGDEDDIVKDLLGSILRSAFRGGDLTQRLLAFSRKQALLPASIDLNEHVLNMTEILHRSIDATIEIKVAAEAGLWRCSADPGQLESAILNLAINARDAMPNGGKLTIKTANAPLDRAYADSQEEVTPGDYAMVAITDTGVGIQPEELEHVFEPFYTTKDVGEGSGLGLSMVYGFAKQSGGHVAIHSEIDQGTTVRLYLPCAQDARPPTRPAVPEGEPAGRGETLLVVEDDAELRKVTAGLLEDLGYVVLEASDGASAMTVFEENNGIDLLLTDVVLPGGVDGGKLAKDILVRNGEIKVLYMSGYTEDVTNDQHNLDSEMVLLQKPFSKCDLAVKVRMMLDTASG